MAYNASNYWQPPEYNERGDPANGKTGSLTSPSVLNANTQVLPTAANKNVFAEMVKKPALIPAPMKKTTKIVTPAPPTMQATALPGVRPGMVTIPMSPTADPNGTSTTYGTPSGGTTTAPPAPFDWAAAATPDTGARDMYVQEGATNRGGPPARPAPPPPPGTPPVPPPSSGSPNRGGGPSNQPVPTFPGSPEVNPWEGAPAPPGSTTVIPSTIGRPNGFPAPVGGVEPPVVTSAPGGAPINPADPGRYYNLTPFEMFRSGVPVAAKPPLIPTAGTPTGPNVVQQNRPFEMGPVQGGGGGYDGSGINPPYPIPRDVPAGSPLANPIADPNGLTTTYNVMSPENPSDLPPQSGGAVPRPVVPPPPAGGGSPNRGGGPSNQPVDGPVNPKSLIPAGPVEPPSILYGAPGGGTTTAPPSGGLVGLSGLSRGGAPTVGAGGPSVVSANGPTGLTSVNAGKTGGPVVGTGVGKTGTTAVGAGGKTGAPVVGTGGLAGKTGTPGLGQGPLIPSTPGGGTRPSTPSTSPTAPSATPGAPATPATPGAATPGQPPATGLQSPDDLSWMDKIQQDALDAARRQGTHLASLTGAVDSGGFVPGMQEEFNRLVNQFGAQKGAMMFEAQQNAAARVLDKYKFDNAQDLQKWIKENEFELAQAGIDANLLMAQWGNDAQIRSAAYGADAASAAAQAGSAASMYNAQLDYQLGQQRLGFDRYATDQGNAINWGQLGLGFQNSGNQYNLGLYGQDVAREANIMDYLSRAWANGPEWARFISGSDPSALIPGTGFGGIQVVT